MIIFAPLLVEQQINYYEKLLKSSIVMFDTGTTTFMMVATSLVMLMTPGLGVLLWRTCV